MTDARIDAYLSAFEAEARKLGLRDARDIANDVRSHIDEAVQYGKPLDAVLQSLGTPKALARAYAVELLMDAPPREASFAKFAQLAALVAFGGIITLVVVTALGATGVSLALSGLMLFSIGVLEALSIHLPHVEMGFFAPWHIILLGPLFVAVGWGLLLLLRAYVRFVGRQLMRAIPRRA